MNRENSLIKNTAILSLGTFVPKFITVFIIPILTARLTKFEYGSYDLILTIVALFLPITTLQISSSAFRFLISYKNNLKYCTKIISTILIFTVINSSIASLIFFILYRELFSDIGILVCLYFISDILMILLQQILRGLGENLYFSFSIIVKAVLDLGLILLLLGNFGTKNYGLTGVLLSMCISSFSSFVFLFKFGNIKRYFNIRAFDIKILKKLLNYSWPMVPNNLSNWILRVSDKVIITMFLGLEANATYAVANKLPTIFDSLQNTFTLAWQENASIASKDNDKDKYYSYMCRIIFKLFVGLMACLIAGTPIIWNILIKGDYNDAYYQLPILYMAMLFSSYAATLGGIYIACMKTKNVGVSTTIAAVINLLIDFILINKIGIWAASISTLVSYFILVLYRMYDIQKFQKLYFNFKEMFFGIFMLSIMAACSYQKNITFNILNIIFCFLILRIYNKEVILNISKNISSKLKGRI